MTPRPRSAKGYGGRSTRRIPTNSEEGAPYPVGPDHCPELARLYGGLASRPGQGRFTARPALSLEETAMPVRFPTLTPFEARIPCISERAMEVCQFE